MITCIKIRSIDELPPVKAIVSITIDHEFTIHDLQIRQGVDRLYVGMPNRPNCTQPGYSDIIHPITTKCRKEWEEAILDKYEYYLLEYADKRIEEAECMSL